MPRVPAMGHADALAPRDREYRCNGASRVPRQGLLQRFWQTEPFVPVPEGLCLLMVWV
jgi:hypothetical protein